MDIFTTRTDYIGDTGIVDMGYHYPKAIVIRSADIDENWHVDFMDFAILAGDWDRCSEPCDSNMLPGDIFPDWCLDFDDLAVLVDRWLDCYVASAKNPTPSGNATGVDPNIILNWTPGAGAVSHDVYFGTDYNDVNNATIDSNEYMGNQDTNSWDPNSYDSNGLALATTYHWRIDGVGARCESKGDVWSFTTWVDPNFVSWWKFDEGSGSTAYDSAGDNDGTLAGNTNWVTGKIGDYALDFDGDDAYVLVPDSDSISVGNQDYTISAWINPRSLKGPSGAGTIVSKVKDGSDKEYQLLLIDEDLWFDVEKNANNQAAETTTAPVQTDSWQHIAVTFNSSTTTPTFYYNGAVQTSTSNIDTLPDELDDDLYIGMTGGVYYTNEFNGTIDDVRIYNRALSAGEIWQLYQLGQE
jgi:hypothetical protein